MTSKKQTKVAFLTAGGIAPCLSAAIGSLMIAYDKVAPQTKMIGYLHGYRGLLMGNSINIDSNARNSAEVLLGFGGSPIGISRVKLTNPKDCLNRGFISEGEDPVLVAANQLLNDEVNVLHTIGGDDTNTMAAELVSTLAKMGADLTVVGLPKTVDNDVTPIVQTLGAATAAEQGAIFFENIANENTTSHRQLLIHEVMGRHCGWLTAATAREYRQRLEKRTFVPEILLASERWDIDAIYIPENEIDFSFECDRLKDQMDKKDGVNIFLSEGAGIETIVKEMEGSGEEVDRDAFGHVKLDYINPGQWFAKKIGEAVDADKILVQKSGYFARSSAANKEDLSLIKNSAEMAVGHALKGNSGVIGQDIEKAGSLSLIDFKRIAGGKPFNPKDAWFEDMLLDIGQH